MAFNASYIHKNLALRWLYVVKDDQHQTTIKEYTTQSAIAPIIQQIGQEQVTTIGLSVYIFNAQISKQFIQALKATYPTINIIVGGPEVTYQVDQWLAIGADVVIRGEGEQLFWQAVNGQLDYPGIASKMRPQTAIAITDLSWLETFENPYFLPFDQQDQDKRYLYVESSRGCPFLCTYCTSSIDQGVRFFSLATMSKVIQKLEESSINQVKFLDRTFNVQPQRALTLIRQLNDIKRPLSVQLETEGSIWHKSLHQFFLHEGKPERFRFEIGVQSLHEPTLKAVMRKQNNAMVLDLIAQLNHKKYVVHADLIAGLPYETIDQFQLSFKQLFWVSPKEIQVGILKGLPGTPIVAQAKELGLVFDPHPPYTIIKNPWLSEADLEKIKMVALAIDKTYNKPLAKQLYKALATDQLPLWDILVAIGFDIAALSHPYQPSDIYNILIKQASMVIDQDLVIGYLANDLAHHPQKPIILKKINKKDQAIQRLMLDISDKIKVNKDQWLSSSWIQPAIVNHQLAIQVIVYSQNKHFFYSTKGEFMHEQNHFTSN